MATFDFTSFLSSLDPENTYTITHLTGGLVNLTVRATRHPKPTDEEQRRIEETTIFKDHNTIILKYAPPFVAKVGEDAKFPWERQLTEARALEIINTRLSSVLQNNPAVKVPEVLYHDVNDHVLCISDLGEVVTLSEVIKQHYDSRTLEVWRKIGRNIGAFLGELHSPAVRRSVRDEDVKVFNSGGQRELVRDAAVTPILQILKELKRTAVEGDSIHDLDVEAISIAVESEFDRCPSKEEECFVIGDFWTGGILLYPSPPEGTVDEKLTGIIDFEFANVGKGVGGDFGQLMADLALLQMSGEDIRAPWAVAAGEVIRGLGEGYRCSSLERGSRWMRNGDGRKTALNARILRSGYLILGREMVNMSVCFEWDCKCCEEGAPADEKKKVCKLLRRMKETGAWYLKMVGGTTQEFVENWRELKRGDKVFVELIGDHEVEDACN
ncbi:hypothetical protein ABW19_dt0204749 [Dactylella cylindrospora]|nr:hypothetical protein ABW19_dt0204749 [Dactylella cylindrospora]